MLIRRGHRDSVAPVSRPSIENQPDVRPGHYYTVRPRDTLEDLAWRFYRDSTRWTTIARVNDIPRSKEIAGR